MGLEEELLYAIKLGKVSKVRELVNADANVHARRIGGADKIPLTIVETWEDKDITSKVFPEVYFPLHLAVSSGDIEIVKILLDAGAEVDFMNEGQDSPLHQAVGTENIQIVEILLERGANPNAKNLYHETPVFSAVMNNDVNMVKVLAQRGARLNYQNYNEDMPLHRAIGSAEMVRTLIELGANVNIQNYEGDTPLHLAAQRRSGPSIILDLARARGADINIQNRKGDTPLHLIARQAEYKNVRNTVSFIKAREIGLSCQKESSTRGDIVRILMTSGADHSIKNKRREAPKHDSITEFLNERPSTTKIPSSGLSNMNNKPIVGHSWRR